MSSGSVAGSGWAISDGQPGPLEPIVADQRAVLGQRRVQGARIGRLGQPLDAAARSPSRSPAPLELLFDVPLAVGGLAPRRPVERDVGDDPRRLALTGQAVARLPREVAEQHVGLEVLLERLPFEERRLEGVAQGADRIGEDMVEHLGAEATAGGRVRLPA